MEGTTKKKRSEPKFSFSDELSAKTDSARFSMSEQTLSPACPAWSCLALALSSARETAWPIPTSGQTGIRCSMWGREGARERGWGVCAICDRASIGFRAPLFHVSLFGVLERPLTPFCAVLTAFVLAIVCAPPLPLLFPCIPPLSLSTHCCRGSTPDRLSAKGKCNIRT